MTNVEHLLASAGYNATVDETISLGGFYHRSTPSLAEYLRDLVDCGLDEVAVPDTVNADINRVRDVMITDGTVLWLHEFLSKQFQARKKGTCWSEAPSAPQCHRSDD